MHVTILGIFIVFNFFFIHSRQTFANIHKLLRPNGVAIINFLVYTPLYDIYMEMSRFRKYRKYMTDVQQFISPYHGEKYPSDKVKKYAEKSGLKIKHLEVREKIFIYRNAEHVKGKSRENIMMENN